MRILIALAFCVLSAAAVSARIPSDCMEYDGVPCPLSTVSPEAYLRGLVPVADGFCGIEGYYGLRFWSVTGGGVPERGGLLAITHSFGCTQLASDGERLYAACGEMGIVIHEIVDATPVAVDSILASRSSRLVAVAGDRLITSRGTGRLLFFDLAGPAPALVDSLDLADLRHAGARGAGNLALVQTSSPPRAHVVDPAAAAVLGTVDLPWNAPFVSWDGRMAVLRESSGEETVLLDASTASAPVLQPLPTVEDLWFVGGAMVDGLLWLTGCDFSAGGLLARFDVTDPANPVYLGRQPWSDTMTESVIVGGAVHTLTESIPMCTSGGELESMSIGSADPLPQPIGYLEDSDLDSADHADLSGDLLCRTNGDRLSIVDFTDITAPVLRAEVTLPEHVSSPHIVAGEPLVVVFGSGAGVAGVGGRIFVYDIGDPAAPALRTTQVCYRFLSAARDGDRLYTFGVDGSLYVWQLGPDGSVALIMEHADLTYDDYGRMLACGDLLFAVDDTYGYNLVVWDFADPRAPVAVTDLPASQVVRFQDLARWDGGIYWSGIAGVDRYATEMLTITDGAPVALRLLYEFNTNEPAQSFGYGTMDTGDRLYLDGPGILALDIVSDPPVALGLIPAYPGRLHVINGYPVVEGYHTFQSWAPACGLVTAAPTGPAPAMPSLEAWPNPFNPRLTVAFTLREAAPVEVSVYDLRGRRLRTLVRGTREAGRQTAQWNGRDEAGRTVAAGVYIVRLELDARTATRRVTLLK